ncbi:AraC family transcriptional regulator, partial [Burkholderia pseudomallei]
WTLARIAEHCRFTSQSQFPQSVAKAIGLPPGARRRRARA